jgi:hypothetical protein
MGDPAPATRSSVAPQASRISPPADGSGSGSRIEAVADRVREVSGDDMETFVFGLDDEGFLREAGDKIDLPPSMAVKAPVS